MPIKIRTRFAPSPTGYMHIGNLRTALYEYLIARANHGTFILRIEDTDKERYVEGAIEVIYETLKKAGLSHDEGPDIGGPFGPYIQSERMEIYIKYGEKLIELDGAYYCFCSKEELAKQKLDAESAGQVYRYDRHCLKLNKEQIENNLTSGLRYVIRQKIPHDSVTISFADAVYGTINVDSSELEDQVLIKSDGFPTYNFANVVDDHLMEITHIVRGNEYLSSTPKYNLLYNAFGWEIPIYVHVPLILKSTGQKLAKRAGDPSFEDLLESGYLIDAVINYVVLLGWSPGGTEEIFTLSELERVFKIEGISKSPAIFDINKLNWMNGEYIKKLHAEEFFTMALPWLKKSIDSCSLDLKKIASLLQARTDVLTQIPSMVGFFQSLPEYDIELYTHKKMKTTPGIALQSLKEAKKELQGIENWQETDIHDALINLAARIGFKNSQLLWPVRIALSGKESTPGGAIEIAFILGKVETLRRLEIGMQKLL